MKKKNVSLVPARNDFFGFLNLINSFPKTVVTLTAPVVCTSRQERNAMKRVDKAVAGLSPFTKGTKVDSKSYRMDCALAEFHTLGELVKKTGCTESLIKRHVAYLHSHFSATCKLVSEGKAFRFIQI